jgi:[ribosomal protein S5]-alanine N-acetyltransferase
MLFRDLETPRLLLKSLSDEDLDFVFRQFSDPVVCKYLYDEEPFTEVAQAAGLIQYFRQPEPRCQHRWVVVRKSDGAKMGTCGFHHWIPADNTAETGYDLREEYWGNGYMLEALRAIIRFAREDMKLARIDAVIYGENIKSASLAQKLGFVRNGSTFEVFRGVKMPHDVYILSIENENPGGIYV